MVSSTRFAEAADSLPFGVSVITAAEIERAGVSTVNEAIIKLLGVPGRLDLYGGGDYGLDLRGFGATAGSNTSTMTMTRSSTTSQPTAIWPLTDLSRPLA